MQIVYNGTMASGMELNPRFNMRRKFIELWLYSQGLLIAEHYYWLLRKYHAAEKSNAPSFTCSPFVLKSIIPL